ncbi:MAG: peptide chain release factor 1 [Betaproteobacteria bacterium]|nr:peptide chain release factor 1 [Betaproteobacteria bacterium]
MNANLDAKLAHLKRRWDELNRLLASEQVTSDLSNYRRLSREHAELEPIVTLYVARQQCEQDLRSAMEMTNDSELRSLAEDEVRESRARIEQLETLLQRELLPKDPNDDRNIFLEIRAGTGGDESALFAADLFRMYSRFSERRGWRMEIVSESPSDLGGYKELIAKIWGHGAYSQLKFESGGHRVQRVPATETQGRIHTSACTVAVLPEADEVAEVEFRPGDLRIDTFRASGAGGQHVNKTDSAVRITHVPTGIVVECQDDRSQHKNKAQALAVLAARLRDRRIRQQVDETAAHRRSLIGSGDRSERIRTYNFPQGRVTDHRINLTLHKITQIMDGDLDDLISALTAEQQAEQLAALSEEP